MTTIEQEEKEKFIRDIAPFVEALVKTPIHLNIGAINKYFIESMGLDYEKLPPEIWHHIIPKLIKLQFRVSQGDRITQSHVNKLINRELRKLNGKVE